MIAPRKGPGYSAGTKPPSVTKGSTARPGYSNGQKFQRSGADPKGAKPMSK